MMNIIGGLDYPSSGTYLLDDIEVNKLNKNDLADIRNRKIGFIFQGFNLLARTSAQENVELPLLYDRSGRNGDPKKLAAEALEKVGLGDRADHHPNELSGGQQQRVAIARALVTSPSLLLADEPTGNLDPANKVRIIDLLKSAAEAIGSTIITVTHDHSLLDRFDRVIDFDRLGSS